MLTSIVVAVDLEGVGEQALPWHEILAGSLACPWRSSRWPRQRSRDAAGHRPRAAGRARWSHWARSILVVHDDDPARAIAAQVNNSDGALLVMATMARSALGLPVHESLSEQCSVASEGRCC